MLDRGEDEQARADLVRRVGQEVVSVLAYAAMGLAIFGLRCCTAW
jgi:hypothetical protein